MTLKPNSLMDQNIINMQRQIILAEADGFYDLAMAMRNFLAYYTKGE